MSDTAVIVDGNAVIYRAYFATQAKKPDEQVFAEFHFTLASIKKTIRNFLKEKNLKYAVVTFDTSKSSFRKDKFEEYKSNRKSMPLPLLQNLQKIREVFKDEGFAIVDAPQNYEGDDVVATLSCFFSKQGIKSCVFSTDRDLLQLVSSDVSVFLIRKGEFQKHTFDNFSELNNGLQPHQIAYQKALSGDSSDNYKGLDGIGPVTSRNWLIKYGDIDNLYKNIDKLSASHQKTLTENKKKLEMFLELSSLVKDLDISPDLKQYEYVKKNNETDSRTR